MLPLSTPKANVLETFRMEIIQTHLVAANWSKFRKQTDAEQEVQPNYTCLSNENFIWAEIKPSSNFF